MQSRLFALLLCVPTSLLADAEWSGFVSFEGQLFNHQPLFSGQSTNNLSVSASPEFYTNWDNEQQSLTIRPFARLDKNDDERSHFDVRELMYYRNLDSWELKAGIGKVFWGVTESQHLVDIINQTDLIESLDGEEKLGQPMLNLSFARDWGTTDIFVLPGFRPRTFPGQEGRLRSEPYVAADQEQYTSDKEDRHIDYALRYIHTINDWDIGLSYFFGTSRDPRFIPGLDANANPVLIPVYDLLHQTGLDLQWVSGDWLWKLEAVHKRISQSHYNAYTFGFEYTWVGINDSDLDLGLISEYLYDSRGKDATTAFQRDILLGARLVFNDTQSSEILAGVIVDQDSNDKFYSVEASTRLTDNWKLNVEARIFSNLSPASSFYSLRADDFVQIELLYYF
jgi:hypothetical protein